MKKYFFEGIIIFCSVFLSLYLNNLNNELIEEKQKKEYLIDLKNSVDMDILQIESLINTLLESEKLINNLQDDIDRYSSVTKEDVIRVYRKYIKNKKGVILRIERDMSEKDEDDEHMMLTLVMMISGNLRR